jgi:hypothetical protein
MKTLCSKLYLTLAIKAQNRSLTIQSFCNTWWCNTDWLTDITAWMAFSLPADPRVSADRKFWGAPWTFNKPAQWTLSMFMLIFVLRDAFQLNNYMYFMFIFALNSCCFPVSCHLWSWCQFFHSISWVVLRESRSLWGGIPLSGKRGVCRRFPFPCSSHTRVLLIKELNRLTVF